MPQSRDSFALGDTIVIPGETRHIRLPVSESYVSTPVEIPLTIINGIGEGPILLVTAASHGDECNGTAIVRQLVYGVDHSNLRGVLVCAPVLNLPGFLRNERDLPDGRDLNRNFPGKPDGNSAQRIANRIFTQIVQKCDYGVDLHTATRGRTNILQVRGDMTNTEVRRIARAYGSEIVIDEPGLSGTLRRAATESGIPTLTAEIGESQRFEKHLVASGLAGVMNVLYELGMMKGKPAPPLFQVIVKKTEWVRADRGGILEMIASPRALVSEGEEICTITNPFGKEVGSVRAPFTGMVVGITNYPMVAPGSPICHLVKLDKTLATVESALRREKSLQSQVIPIVLSQPAGPVAATTPERPDHPPGQSTQGNIRSEKEEKGSERATVKGATEIGMDERPPAEAGGLHPIGAAWLPPPEGGGLLSNEERPEKKVSVENAPKDEKHDKKKGADVEMKEERPNNHSDMEGPATEYYEDYDEDAEPEEKE
jgi:hypothetical protein